MTVTSSDLVYAARILRLPIIAEQASTLADQARDQHWGYEKYLVALLSRQAVAREANGMTKRIRRAHFPKTPAPWKTLTGATRPARLARSSRPPRYLHIRRYRRQCGYPGPARGWQDTTGDRVGYQSLPALLLRHAQNRRRNGSKTSPTPTPSSPPACTTSITSTSSLSTYTEKMIMSGADYDGVDASLSIYRRGELTVTHQSQTRSSPI